MSRSLFHHTVLADGLLQIQGPMGFCAALAAGRRRALLFDTMCGVGDLAGYVRGLTALPLVVVNSHGHFDHVGGNYQFDAVYLAPEEYEATRWLRQADLRRELVERLETNGGFVMDSRDRRRLLDQGRFDRYLPLTPGQVFDLGGVRAQAVPLPGHTAGSTGLLLREWGILLSGDAMTPIMCLFFPESVGLGVYTATLERAMELPLRGFVTGHHPRLFPASSLRGFLACARAVPNMRPLPFQHGIFPEYTGKLYIYRGENAQDEDFLALIGPGASRRPGKGGSIK